MEPITSEVLMTFLERLGEQSSGTATLYLLGGSALCLLGNPRSTLDVDYDLDVPGGTVAEFRALVDRLAADMQLDLELVRLHEFVPIPPDASQRRRLGASSDRLPSTSSICTASP